MTSQTKMTAGQKFTHNGRAYTFSGYWFSNVTKQTYAMARSVTGHTDNIPVTEMAGAF